MTDAKLDGGCACGAIRYEATSEPKFSFLCQCRDCQQATGTGHSAAMMIDREATTLTGDLTWYERTAPSGNTISQGFCGTCGSPMMNKTPATQTFTSSMPDRLTIPTSLNRKRLSIGSLAQIGI